MYMKKSVKLDKINKPLRKQRQEEIHQQWVDEMLAKRRLQQNPPPKTLKSVHSDLQGTKSKEYVSKLKRKPTESETLVLDYLNRLNREYVFQMPIKNDYSFYIIDFYIPSSRLCIEVDGGYHTDSLQMWRDEQRDMFLHKNGYKVLRFTNEEIENATFWDFKRILQQYEEFDY